MNCQSAHELLSAYFDRELEPHVEEAMREHLPSCELCARRLLEFEQLSRLAAEMRQPEVPPHLWHAIESSLAGSEQQLAERAGARRLLRRSWAAIAATVAVAAAVVVLAYGTWRSFDPHVEMAVVFDRYLSEFQESPQRALGVLRTRYDGRLMDPQAGVPNQFRPNAPRELPDGFARVETYVLTMPCCTCTQTIYRNTSGDTVVLFEHSEDQRTWFGKRPMIEARCHGKPAFLVQLHDSLAATWKCGPRYLTVVGVRNVEQVSELIAFLDGQRRGEDG